MGYFEQNLREAVFAAERAEEDFTRLKDKTRIEVATEYRSRGSTLPANIDVLVSRRMAGMGAAKEIIAQNQWQIQRAIMYSNLELIEQQRTIIDLLTKIVEK